MTPGEAHYRDVTRRLERSRRRRRVRRVVIAAIVTAVMAIAVAAVVQTITRGAREPGYHPTGLGRVEFPRCSDGTPVIAEDDACTTYVRDGMVEIIGPAWFYNPTTDTHLDNPFVTR